MSNTVVLPIPGNDDAAAAAPCDARLRVTVGNLAATREPGCRASERQRAENAVVALLYPPALAAAVNVSRGELTPPQLERLTSAVLTRVVRRTPANDRRSFGDRALQALLAEIECSLSGCRTGQGGAARYAGQGPDQRRSRRLPSPRPENQLRPIGIA